MKYVQQTIFISVLTTVCLLIQSCTSSEDLLTPRVITELTNGIDTMSVVSIQVSTTLNDIRQDVGTKASNYTAVVVKKDSLLFVNLTADFQSTEQRTLPISLLQSKLKTGLRLASGKSYSNNGNSNDTTFTTFNFHVTHFTYDTTTRDSLFVKGLKRDSTQQKIDTLWDSVKVTKVVSVLNSDSVNVRPSTVSSGVDNALMTMVHYATEKRILCTLTYTTQGDKNLYTRLYNNNATLTISFEIFYKE